MQGLPDSLYCSNDAARCYSHDPVHHERFLLPFTDPSHLPDGFHYTRARLTGSFSTYRPMGMAEGFGLTVVVTVLGNVPDETIASLIADASS